MPGKSKSKRRTQSSLTKSPQAGASFGGLQRKEETFEFNPDYTYIRRDLRRIGILAGSIFVVLIALYFVVPLIIK
jgi:hypothetical protein